jgi:Carboxypeptidase regulatory-like domain
MKFTKPVMVCVALLSFLFLTTSASAQSYRAQIRGLVTDNSGAVLPGATVTLANVDTGVNVTRQSDTEGLYIFDYVNPGTYRITVTMSGFGDFMQENISVQSGGDVTVNVNMKPGALRQSVTVEASPPAVEFNFSNQELTIDTKMANDTPCTISIMNSGDGVTKPAS